jgi:hypothetical protein
VACPDHPADKAFGIQRTAGVYRIANKAMQQTRASSNKRFSGRVWRALLISNVMFLNPSPNRYAIMDDPNRSSMACIESARILAVSSK